ncbi:MAG: hypothetical protein JWO45_735 [Spartobacteria bacterium]|nr:hypothetical protein [Spartobacteria bacterium]
MKRTLIAIGISTVALALTAVAEDNNQAPKAGKRAKASAVTTVNKGNTAGQVRTRQSVSNRHANNFSRRNNSNVGVQHNTLNSNHIRSSGARNLHQNGNVHRDVAATSGNTLNRRNATLNRERNVRVNRQNGLQAQGNFGANRNVTINRERNINRRNVTVVNNWRGAGFNGQNYAAFRNYHRQWHDRGWWSGHYNRIIFVSGGWYFWNSGFWYPAWGYDPGYQYPYDGPIYGYRDLTPDRVIVNVQSQLQRDGYYDGPVDGILGEQTREGIAAFQADHGLAITSAIDEPTLASLGLV